MSGRCRALKALGLATLVASASAVVVACKQRGVSTVKADAASPWDKRRWIAKAGRALSGNRDLASADLERYAALDHATIVQQMLQTPQFADAVFDFGRFALQAKTTLAPWDQNPDAPNYTLDALAVPAAVTIAHEVMTTAGPGDITRFFNYYQPYYIQINGPLSSPPPVAQLSVLDNVIKAFGPAPYDAAQGCAAYLKDGVGAAGIIAAYLQTVATSATSQQLHNTILNALAPLNDGCTSAPSPALYAGMAQLRSGLGAYLDTMTKADAWAKTNPPISVLNTWAFDPGLVGRPDDFTTLTLDFFAQHGSSSTNYHRNRAAYVLKTFFGDDLTPVNAALPASHAGGKHASDPACQPCHYKLDPIGGFFRYRGQSGHDFSNDKRLIFDDGAIFTGDQYDAYLASWNNPDPASGGKPLIGYIRSADTPDDNNYGLTMPDLFGIIHDSDEARTTLVKDMAIYFVGAGQTFDGNWLASLADEIKAAPNTAAGFKSVVASLILSNTFAQSINATSESLTQCYDFVPGAAKTTLPCSVAWIIQNNCVTCHGSTRKGKLDLNLWQTQKDGSENFAHTDAAGTQRTVQDTFTRLAARLSSSDPDFLMPKGGSMLTADRAALYKWVVSTLASLPASAATAPAAASPGAAAGATPSAEASGPTAPATSTGGSQ